MSPHRGSNVLKGKGSTDVGPVHAEDSWCLPSTSVAETVGSRVEELVLLQHLREELLSKQVRTSTDFLTLEDPRQSEELLSKQVRTLTFFFRVLAVHERGRNRGQQGGGAGAAAAPE